MLTKQCLKQTTFAVIMKDKKVISFGSNFIHAKIDACSREETPSGVGYDLCKNVCKQHGHAEYMACKNAGDLAKGGTLYLIGHTYACEECITEMKKHGIIRLIICDTGKIIELQ